MHKVAILFFVLQGLLPAQSSLPYWLVGYYAPVGAGAQNPALVPWNKYTHVNHFAVFPSRNCTINDTLVREQIKEFVSSAHENKKRALITLKDNDESPDIFLTCTNSTHMAAFIEAITRFVISHEYDGVDLDWELVPRFSGAFVERYEDLITRLRSHLKDKVLMMAVYANAPAHALERVAAESQGQLDRVSVMCYDMDGVGTGSPQSWYVAALRQAGDDTKTACDATVSAFTSRGLAARKINIGFPFYGRIYPNITSAGLQRGNLARTSVYYRDLVQDSLRWRESYKRYDKKHGANYLSIPSPQEFVTYGGPEMIDDLVEWVKATGFGGIMTFTTGYEYLANESGDRRYPLSSRIYDRLYSESLARIPSAAPIGAGRH